MKELIEKAKHFGENIIVETSHIFVDGDEVSYKQVEENMKLWKDKVVEWKILFGVNNGKSISIFQGGVIGTLNGNVKFSNYFRGIELFIIPNNETKTISELEDEGNFSFSPRKIAIENMLNNNLYKKIYLKNS